MFSNSLKLSIRIATAARIFARRRPTHCSHLVNRGYFSQIENRRATPGCALCGQRTHLSAECPHGTLTSQAEDAPALSPAQQLALLKTLSGISAAEHESAPEDKSDAPDSTRPDDKAAAQASEGGPIEESDVDDDEEDLAEGSEELTPKRVVEELEKHVVGQAKAKRCIAVALRNRWRRRQLDAKAQAEVTPKNILMVGPSGIGKTELARRLAKLVDAPFVKVEATKYTEVGFHGKDVESIIFNLVEVAMQKTKERKRRRVQKQVRRKVEDVILQALVGKQPSKRPEWRAHLRAGLLDNQYIELELPVREPEGQQPQQLILRAINGGKTTEKKKMTIKEAWPILEDIEAEKLMDDVVDDALREAENGIVFIDEIDKICTSKSHASSHADASAEGVQRDLLPLIEGCAVSTKHGTVNTDHILFIGSGAFLSVSPDDMMPELQGRLPIRITLDSLTENDFYRILTEPEYNVIKQQQLLLKTEGVDLLIEEAVLREIARVSFEVNRHHENIGARRLHAVVESVMEAVSFEAADLPEKGEHRITLEKVREATRDMMRKEQELVNYVF